MLPSRSAPVAAVPTHRINHVVKHRHSSHGLPSLVSADQRRDPAIPWQHLLQQSAQVSVRSYAHPCRTCGLRDQGRAPQQPFGLPMRDRRRALRSDAGSGKPGPEAQRTTTPEPFGHQDRSPDALDHLDQWPLGVKIQGSSKLPLAETSHRPSTVIDERPLPGVPTRSQADHANGVTNRGTHQQAATKAKSRRLRPGPVDRFLRSLDVVDRPEGRGSGTGPLAVGAGLGQGDG